MGLCDLLYSSQRLYWGLLQHVYVVYVWKPADDDLHTEENNCCCSSTRRVPKIALINFSFLTVRIQLVLLLCGVLPTYIRITRTAVTIETP